MSDGGYVLLLNRRDRWTLLIFCYVSIVNSQDKRAKGPLEVGCRLVKEIRSLMSSGVTKVIKSLASSGAVRDTG